MKITDYDRIQQLKNNSVILVDGDNGTKIISAYDLAKSLIGLMSSQEFISGVNLSELPLVNTLSAGDKVLVGTPAGNKAMDASDSLFAILDAFVPVEKRRTILRGKNLGAAVTAEQKAAIKDGSFKGLFLGDYWYIGSHKWRIADFNYWQNCGDANFITPHLVIMPDNPLYNHVMNETNVTTGGYVGSLMYTEGLTQAKTLAASAFPGMVLTHREYLVNAVTNGYPSAGAWYDPTLKLPNEIMMYGCHVYAPAADGSTIPIRYTINNSQLALMAACPWHIKQRTNYWLRDVVSAALFALVRLNGLADHSHSSGSFGVRPVFPIG